MHLGLLVTLVFSSMGFRDVSTAEVTQLNYPSVMQIDVPLGNSPRFVTSGDFNSDSYPDIVTRNSNGTISLALNNGGTGFSPAVTIPIPGLWIEAGDFNNDGKIDLLTVRFAQTEAERNEIHIHLGDGTGAIDLVPIVTDLSSGVGHPKDITIDDFNSDGQLDVAIAGVDSVLFTPNGFVWVCMSLGGGSFLTNTIGVRPRAIDVASGDFNGDGKVDLAVRSIGGLCFPNPCVGAIQLIFSNGNGQFPTRNNLDQYASLGEFVAGDVNDDGKIDLVGVTEVSGLPGNTLTAILGTGLGDFVPGGSYQIGTQPVSGPILADFNGDGRTDTAVRDRTSGLFVYIAWGNGAGGYSGYTSPGAALTPADLVVDDFDGNEEMDLAVANSQSKNVSVLFGPISPAPPGQDSFDFDGDNKADIAVYRDGTTPGAPSYWYVLRSSTNTFQGVQQGANGDMPVPVDFNGDGKSDFAVWRPSNGTWYTSTDATINYGAFHWGQNGDVPMPGDFDGDGKADYGVYRPSNGTWYVIRSSDGGFENKQIGSGADKPILGDFDGDGKYDYAIYRPGTSPTVASFWLVQKSGDGQFLSLYFGAGGDIPVPADYNGDGKTNFAVFRPSYSTWYTSLSSSTNYGAIKWGAFGDVPAPADYDGDGIADLAIFRPGIASWYIFQSSNGTVLFQQWGISSDRPIPSSLILP